MPSALASVHSRVTISCAMALFLCIGAGLLVFFGPLLIRKSKERDNRLPDALKAVALFEFGLALDGIPGEGERLKPGVRITLPDISQIP